MEFGNQPDRRGLNSSSELARASRRLFASGIRPLWGGKREFCSRCIRRERISRAKLLASYSLSHEPRIRNFVIHFVAHLVDFRPVSTKWSDKVCRQSGRSGGFGTDSGSSWQEKV